MPTEPVAPTPPLTRYEVAACVKRDDGEWWVFLVDDREHGAWFKLPKPLYLAVEVDAYRAEVRRRVEALEAEWRAEADELDEAARGQWVEPGVKRACADALKALTEGL